MAAQVARGAGGFLSRVDVKWGKNLRCVADNAGPRTFCFRRRPQRVPEALGSAWDRRGEIGPKPAVFGLLGTRLDGKVLAGA